MNGNGMLVLATPQPLPTFAPGKLLMPNAAAPMLTR